jgi:predicted MFS family arabinose efflux permease
MLWWISFFNYADRQAIFSVFDLLRNEMHLSQVELGWLGSSFAWVYGLSAPLAGLMVDRVRRKSAILGGLQVWSLICLATASARSFGQLVFFRAAEGLGETIYYPASMAMLSDYHGQRTRSRALGFHQTSVYAGTIGGAFFGGLIGQRYGWRWSFVVFGSLGMILGIALWRFLVEPRRGAADQPGAQPATPSTPEIQLPLRTTLTLIGRTPTAWLLMLAFLCAMFVNIVLLAWMPDFVRERLGYSLAAAGLGATFYAQVSSMIGSALGGWLADALLGRLLGGRILVQAFGVLGAAPFVYLCGGASSETGLLLALAAWGFFKGIYDANIFAAVFDVVPAEARGTTAGFMNLLGWAGGAPGSLVVGYLARTRGLGSAISSVAGVYIASGVILLSAGFFFIRRDLKPGDGK